MANLLEKYGIKEVCDMIFYERDSVGAPSAPVLYLDSLKVSTASQAAESSDATGGKGNGVLISWDYGRDITVNLEDALFSAKSLAMIYGGQLKNVATGLEVLRTFDSDIILNFPLAWMDWEREITIPYDKIDEKKKEALNNLFNAAKKDQKEYPDNY